MSQPQWATPERKNHLVELAVQYKGFCLKGHALCRHVEHYTTVVTKIEIASGPISPADVREGRAIPFPCHGVGIVELAHAVSNGARPIGPKRVVVQTEELSDLYGQKEEQATDAWKAEDREQRTYDRIQASQLGPTGEVGRFGAFHSVGRRSSYDPVDIDKHVNDRPEYYLMGYGVNGQMQRFAKVKIPGTNVILQVDISQSFQELGEHKRKKLRTKGVKLHSREALCKAAVEEWWGR